MKTIRLTTPAQREDENPAVELHPGNLEQWLKQLPANDIIATVAELDQAVSAFNEVLLPAANRLKLLEIYFNAFHSMLQGYDEMRLAQLKVSSREKSRLANEIMWLYIKLSHGYKIIVKDYVGKSNSAKPPQYLLPAVFRSLELTVVSLIYSYRFGLDAPPLTYIEMHQLYAFAEYYELTDKPVKAASGYARTPTIASYYTLAMIFVSLDPAHYESYTLEVLFLALQPFTYHCPVTRTFKPRAGSYIYKISLAENLLPSIMADSEISSISETTRYLDIENFISGIEAWLDENRDNSNTLLIEHEMELFPAVLTRLKANLNEKKSQLAAAKAGPADNQSVKLVIGFAPLESLLIMKSVDLDLKLNYTMSEWMLQSQSATGCELASHIDLVDDELSLGDLVAMVSGGEDGEPVSPLSIAYICRLQQLEQGLLLLELEYLSGDAHPLTYMMISEKGETIHAAQLNGIYLLDERQKTDSPLMIVNRKHYRESQQYLIKTREKVCTVVARKLVRQTLRYACFEFSILQEEKNKFLDVVNIAV